jgi:hypothetical protein
LQNDFENTVRKIRSNPVTHGAHKRGWGLQGLGSRVQGFEVCVRFQDVGLGVWSLSGVLGIT